MNNAKFLEQIAQIYQAAYASDDGARCMVAPHPDLRARIKSALTSMATASGLPSALHLRAAEPRVLGLNDGVIIPPDAFALGTPPSQIRAAAASRAAGPLRGIVRVIVVLVDFADKPMVQTRQHFQNLFFSRGQAKKSVRDYYLEVTHDLIDLQGDVVGPYRLPKSMKDYAHGAAGMGLATPNAQTMARDAVIASDPHVNFKPYDNDGNGYVDAFIVIHAGAGGEVTGDSNDIWSHKWTLDGGARRVDQTKIYAYLTVPEDCKIGVCAHELGHLLFGFPDLYDTDYSSEGIGDWCLMAGGSWGGGGDVPVHPSAWCKANQGWVTVDNHKANGAVNVADVKASKTIYRLWKGGQTGNEYFLLENRQRTSFDASLPGPGLLIWHIDEGQPDNTNEHHYKVALMQADGKQDLEHNVNRGDAGDAYPGSSNNRAFNAASNPNSKSYGGVDSGVAVTAIGPNGPTMSVQIHVRGAAVAATTQLPKDADRPVESHGAKPRPAKPSSKGKKPKGSGSAA